MRGLKLGLILGGLMWAALLHLAFGASVNLAWDMPTNNVDGSPLTDLAGAKIYQGFASSNYVVITDCPGATTTNATLTLMGAPTTAAWAGTNITATASKTEFVLTWPRFSPGLMPTNYFNGTAYNVAGLESDFCSNEVAKGETATGITYEVRIGALAPRATTNLTLTVARGSLSFAKYTAAVWATWGTNAVMCPGAVTLNNNKPWRLTVIR